MTYIYAWSTYIGLPSLPGRKGTRCRLLVRSPRDKARNIRDSNSALVEFDDGYLAVVSRNALRRAP